MQTDSLRKMIGTIGLVVSITAATIIPGAYLVHSYGDTDETLAFKARLNAARVAQYIYTHNAMWQYQRERLAELIQLPETGEQPIKQAIYDQASTLILEEGPSLAWPTTSHRVPIVVAGTTVGSLVVHTSLRGVLDATGLIAVFSALFGFGVYFAVRLLPLRVLDRTMDALRRTEQNLAGQNERFDAALTNMSQGLCMFGADGRLVISNSRFAEIYGLAPDSIKNGMTTRELMALTADSSTLSDDEIEAALVAQGEFIRRGTAGSLVEKLTDGRSVAVSHRPMPNGGFVATFEDITERLLSEEKIRYLAHHDALTNLPNRNSFNERLSSVMTHLRRSESIAVMSLDLDQFKSVNDTLGHPVGDSLLRAVAERMRSCVRDDDIVARLGGDEFAVLQVPSEEALDVSALAARLIEVVGAPYDLDGHQVVVGTSVGIAIAPADGSEPEVLMKKADLALYRAKADGGNIYRFFEIEMDTRMQARRALELDLRKAVVNGEFELYYQPIVDVKSGQVTSCEALIRWHHPTRGMVAPNDFIPVAEETGVIVPLGEWILRQACAEAAGWPDDITIAVNLSPAQFKSRNLVPTVVNALATSGLAASRLELEITEMVLLNDNDGAFKVLHQFHDLGIKIAMDDFGTGYSSLGYLRSFPFDKIKIDQSFIRDLPNKGESVAIVRAVVGLGSSLGIRTTAEGVETAEQLASLTAEGCNEFQGYLFGRPQPALDVARILNEQSPRAKATA